MKYAAARRLLERRGRRGLWSVYVVDRDSRSAAVGTVARRDVEVLHTEGERGFIRGTIAAGEDVIRTGTHRVVSGQLVHVQDASS